MKKFVALAEHLDQNAIPVFCDEGVFRLVLNIFLKKQSEFKCLNPMLGRFHMAKCVLHCIGKYLNGCELEDELVEINIFGIKVLESVISASHYTSALRGIKILQCGIEVV